MNNLRERLGMGNLGEAVEMENGIYIIRETAEIEIIKKNDDSGQRSLVYVAGTKEIGGKKYLLYSSNTNENGSYGTTKCSQVPLEELSSYECTPLHIERTHPDEC